MSTFSHTDWTVICNGTDPGGRGCTEYGRTDVQEVATAAEVRRILKRRGWLVSVPQPDSRRPGGRVPTDDFCPRHHHQAPSRAVTKSAPRGSE